MLKNLFWDVALDQTLRTLIRKIMWFSFDTSSALRVSWTVWISWNVSTVVTVNTCLQSQIAIWDNWKPATSILMSYQAFNSWIGKNFTR